MSNEQPTNEGTPGIGAPISMTAKNYYPNILELVWASNEDASRVVNGLNKQSLVCLLRESISQLKLGLNTEYSLSDTVQSLASDANQLKAAIPNIESTISSRFKDAFEKISTKIQNTKSDSGASISRPVAASTPASRNNDRKPSDDSHLFRIRIDGISEIEGKPSHEVIKEETAAVEKIFGYLTEPLTIWNMKRLGSFKKDRNRPRTIIVTLPHVWDVRKVLSKAPLLKNYVSKVYLSKSLSHPEIVMENAILKKRRELIESGIPKEALKIRSLKLLKDGEVVNIESLTDQSTA